MFVKTKTFLLNKLIIIITLNVFDLIIQQMFPNSLMSSPAFSFFLRSMAPKNGTPMVEIIIIKVKQKTIIDCLPNFYI